MQKNSARIKHSKNNEGKKSGLNTVLPPEHVQAAEINKLVQTRGKARRPEEAEDLTDSVGQSKILI